MSLIAAEYAQQRGEVAHTDEVMRALAPLHEMKHRGLKSPAPLATRIVPFDKSTRTLAD